MHFHIITLFPDSIRSYVNTSILGRAQRNKKITISYYNPRDFTKDKHKRVDGRPYGGGPGMVIEAEAVVKTAAKAIGRKKNVKIIIFSPSGKQFDTAYAKNLAKKYRHIVLIAGHYEGVDARVQKILKAQDVSIGPYILTGGEVPTMAIIDTVSRQVKGVLGNISSLEDERISSSEVYTRPEILSYKSKQYRAPKVLLEGHHKKIEEWKQRKKK
jgi:tRNA (guanine37-N1)-methyltransferase